MSKITEYQTIYNKLEENLKVYLTKFFTDRNNEMITEFDINRITDAIFKEIADDDRYDEHDLRILGDNNWLYTVATVDMLKKMVNDPKSNVIHINFKQAYLYGVLADIADTQYEQVVSHLTSTNQSDPDKLPDPIKNDLNKINIKSNLLFDKLISYFQTIHLAKKYVLDDQIINRLFANNQHVINFLLNDVQDNTAQVYLDI